MRIRNALIMAFLLATILPTVIFGWWSYENAVKREFAEVKDRHLLLAENLSAALSRYHTDLVGTFSSISKALLAGEAPSNLEPLMTTLNMICVLIVDEASGVIEARVDVNPSDINGSLPDKIRQLAKTTAKSDETVFSEVIGTQGHGNILLGTRRYGDKLAIAFVNTRYFVDLGQQISFGEKGHAAIVDHAGNVLAHPLPAWIESRKNIAKVSAVARMMNGETGIEQFYSPALEGDMIAGLTAVQGPGWGVMIPQPVEEIYAKVRENNEVILIALALGLMITTAFVLLFVNSLVTPLEQFLNAVRRNAEEKRLSRTSVESGIIRLKEVEQFNSGYNAMISRVSEANNKVSAMAFTDGVTGLANRQKFEELAAALLKHNASRNVGGILVFVDLDDFKQINDINGHSIGDRFLQENARKLETVVAGLRQEFQIDPASHGEPIIARIGGDEFVIMFPGPVKKNEIGKFLRTVQAELSATTGSLPEISEQGASIGCSCYPRDGVELDGLLKFADIAMYHAKRLGKNRYEIYSRENGTMTTAEMRVAVDEAIDNEQLVLEYQPKVCTQTRRATGVEALVRWDHPTLGRLAPIRWIPAVSNSPVMRRLGEWVIKRAMDDHREWSERGLDLTVAVNIGAEHFSGKDFTNWLARTAVDRHFETRNMEIEITEDALFSPDVNTSEKLDNLHKQGFKVSVDDFGTGYSNLARLSQMQFDCLKIDRSVISQAHRDERVASMMDCIVMMARALGCTTVAEGVETQSEVDLISGHGIDILQGFYFAQSMPVDDLIRWVRQHNKAAVSRTGNRKTAVRAA